MRVRCVRACVCCASPKYALIIGSCVPWVVRSQYSDGAVLLLSNEITQHAHTRHIRTLYTSSSNNNNQRKKRSQKCVQLCHRARSSAEQTRIKRAVRSARAHKSWGAAKNCLAYIKRVLCARALTVRVIRLLCGINSGYTGVFKSNFQVLTHSTRYAGFIDCFAPNNNEAPDARANRRHQSYIAR